MARRDIPSWPGPSVYHDHAITAVRFDVDTMPATADALPDDACLNCGRRFVPERLRYCPACGQETNVKPPTLLEFAQQFGGNYIAAEGALWRTLKLVLFKPGAATREYLLGRRRHYVLPLRLYLTISLTVLLLLRMVAVSHLEEAASHPTITMPTAIKMKIGFGEAGMEDGRFYCRNLPAWVCARLQKRLDIDPKRFMQELSAMGERLVASLGNAMFVVLPAFALWLRLAYANRGLRFTEHLVFALHVHAFWFLMLALTLLDVKWLTDIASIAVPVYTLLAMRTVYRGRWLPRLARALLVSVLYGITLGAVLTGAAVWALLS
jgi:hypothetical protein